MPVIPGRDQVASPESITTIVSMDSGPAPEGASRNDDLQNCFQEPEILPMALVLTEEQSMLRDSARGLISDKAPVSHLRQLRDGKDATGFSRELWKTFAEMGFAGLLIPENFGGSGLGCVEAGVVMEEIGRTLMPSPFLSTAVLAASALTRGGSEAQKAAHLPKISDGSLLAAFAIDEGAKHRPLQTKLQAVRSGNGFKLNGAKAFVVDGHTADLLIVAARTGGAPGERNGLTLFLVDPKAKGIAIERTAMVDSHNAARIEFANAEVNADSVLGEIDQGGALLEGLLNIGRGAVASEMVGLSEEVFSRTVTYLKERKQFGKLIGEFQSLQHRAAELYIDIEITRAAVLKALQTLDGDFEKAGAAVAVAKARAGTTATRAVQEGVQMHGGMGMTDQFDIGFFMKRARVCQELFGDANYHADQLARMKSY
jgi:alkylation response protein AidB-like acyl-CoA dehydrogenase